MMVITPKHVGAVLMSILMWILKLFLGQLTCASVGEKKNFDNIKMHGMYVEKLQLIYTGCPRMNVPDFGRVFLMLKYTDITQNTYVQSWTVTEIMARDVWNFDSCYTLVDYQIHIKTGRNMWFL